MTNNNTNMTNYNIKKIFLYTGCFLFLLCAVFVIVFYCLFIRVKPDIRQAYENEDSRKLVGFIFSEKENWYQKAEALCYYAQLNCSLSDEIIANFIVHPDTSMRQAVFEGCYNTSRPDTESILSYGLLDDYSWNRYVSLEYIQKQDWQERYKDDLLRLSTDGSSMVKDKALELMVGFD